MMSQKRKTEKETERSTGMITTGLQSGKSLMHKIVQDGSRIKKYPQRGRHGTASFLRRL